MTPSVNGFVASALERSSLGERITTADTPPTPRPPNTPSSLRPAILVCTSKVVNSETRGDYEAWLVDGKRLIEEVLYDKDCQAGLAESAEKNQEPHHRFSWVHFPAVTNGRYETRETETHANETSSHRHKRLTRASTGASVSHVQHSGAPACETVAVVFQRHDDLERWRHSNRRAKWLKLGERFGSDAAVTSRATSIDTDDGSLGGWLPADVSSNESKSTTNTTSPAAWKVYLTVLLAQYPLVEINGLVLLPLVDALDVAAFTDLSQPLRMLLVQSWTSFAAVFVTLPAAQWGLRKSSFLEGGTNLLGVGSVVVAYGAVVAGAFVLQPHAHDVIDAIAKISM